MDPFIVAYNDLVPPHARDGAVDRLSWSLWPKSDDSWEVTITIHFASGHVHTAVLPAMPRHVYPALP